MKTRREFLSNSLLGLGSMLLYPLAARSGTWPENPINIIVGRKAGGGSDGTARLLAPQLEEYLQAPRINVSNMPGASGSRAAKFVRRQAPEGYHWIIAGGYHRGLRAMGFDDAVPYRDWQYYGADSSIMSFSVLPDSPIRDMEDLIRQGIDHPGRLSVSVDGIGGTWHLGALLVMRATGAQFRFIPYGGGKPATVAGLQGEVDVVCSGVHEQIGSIKAGQLRPLGTGADGTLTMRGVELPSVIDVVPGLSNKAPIGGGAAIGVNRNTDPGILGRIADAWSHCVNSDEFIQANQLRGRFAGFSTGEAADKRAALLETLATTLLNEMGIAKHTPADLGLPALDEFEHWWPPRGYQPRI